MRFISLFAGIGGFDLGFERAGLTCVAQVEKDGKASKVLARHFPTVERFEDVNYVGRANLPAADLICGGFPCQDVSVAGKRAGLAGGRSGLWFEFLRILTEVQPQWCVIENVPGLLSSNSGRDFATILQGLVGCGYGVTWRVLDAQHFGVAQRRRRVFIVGSLGSQCSTEVLFEREGVPRHIEPRRQAGQGATAGAEVGVGASSLALASGKPRVETPLANAATKLWTGNQEAFSGDYFLVETLAFMAGQGAKAGGLGLSEMVSPTLKSAASGTNQVPVVAFKSSYPIYGLIGELTALEERVASLTVPSASGGGHPSMASTLNGVRRLTPRECERLQGFPDDWTAEQSDTLRYGQLGNAVCVNVAEWVGRGLINAEELNFDRP